MKKAASVASPLGGAPPLEHPSSLPAPGPLALQPSLSSAPWRELMLTKYPVPGACPGQSPPTYRRSPSSSVEGADQLQAASGILSSLCDLMSSLHIRHQPDVTHPPGPCLAPEAAEFPENEKTEVLPRGAGNLFGRLSLGTVKPSQSCAKQGGLQVG